MNLQMLLERSGFDTARLPFTLRTALAACCAVAVAWLMGLEHPQWSGMSVWAASLPLRGHLLEKSLFRVVGTVLGALFGIALLLVADHQAWIIVLGLALWIGLCAGAGNLIRGLASYGAVLAGYSAAMVTLLHSARWADNPFAVGIDRMLTVLVGVAVALAIGWAFSVVGESEDPLRLVRRLSARILADLADHLAGIRPPERGADQALFSELAAIEDRLDAHAAGSLRLRALVRRIRRALSAEVGLLLWMRRPLRQGVDPALVAALRAASRACADGARNPEDGHAALTQAAELAAFDPDLRDALSTLADANVCGKRAKEEDAAAVARQAIALHRDWTGAREAALRACLVILAVGGLWLATGWQAGALMLLGASIMTTVFSTVDNPVVTLRMVLIGQTLGVIGALICRWLVWPHVGSAAGLVLTMMPFVLFGGLFFAHRRAAGPVGFDYNMVVLLLLQPVWPLTGSFSHSLEMGAAVVLGPAIGLLAFLFIFPVDAHRRLASLMSAMVHEIEAMAGTPGAFRRRRVWRARLYHRVLRIVRWADKTGASRDQLIEAGFALLMLGTAVFHLDETAQRGDLAPGTARRLNLALARLRHVGRDPEPAVRALRGAADRLVREGTGDAALHADVLRQAAAQLSRTEALIRELSTGGTLRGVSS